MRRLVLMSLLVAVAAPASAQPVRPPPKDLLPAEAEIWPFPPPDPKSWWEDKRPVPPEAADPLGGRRLGRGERTVQFDGGIDPSTYRLWGLPPLQWQLLRGDEMILEIWVRPSGSVRQSVVRVTVRRDGKAFVQGRAGLACCQADIARRMGFDAELPAGQAQAFLALRAHPMWTAPRQVRVSEGPDTVTGVCVDGVSYDLALVVPGRSKGLHRACDDAEIGQAADALEPVLRAALGHDGRFDVIFPGGVDFTSARKAYQALGAHGGALKPNPDARPQPPGAGAGSGPGPEEPAAKPPAPAAAGPATPQPPGP
jgi:hypothetical protein